MKDNYFKVLENDIEKEYKIIKAFKHKDINYIIYTDNDEDYYASRYSIVNDSVILDEIILDEEWDYIDKVLEKQKIDSLIIDVRNNPGGHLNQVEDILSLFFNKTKMFC